MRYRGEFATSKSRQICIMCVKALRLMTHIARICGIFDVANLQRYRAGFAPMLFQWSHAHIAHFFIAKNRAIKRGLERKNCAIKKSRYVCHGTKQHYSRYIYYTLDSLTVVKGNINKAKTIAEMYKLLLICQPIREMTGKS